MPRNTNNVPSTSPTLPGYTVVTGPANENYLVPTFMVPATEHALNVERKRIEERADQGNIGPNPVTDSPFVLIAAGDVSLPPVPPLTQKEALHLHAEIRALQERWGLTYKDAAHRLYMAEVERFRVQKEAEQAMENLLRRIDNTILHEIYPTLAKIDSGELDDQ